MKVKKLNKKGISATIENAGMMLIVVLALVIVLQVSYFALTFLTVKGAAYEAARGGSKVGVVYARDKATTIANDYGKDVLKTWSPNVKISISDEIYVEVTQNVPIISKLFKGVKVKAVGRQVIEEIA